MDSTVSATPQAFTNAGAGPSGMVVPQQHVGTTVDAGDSVPPPKRKPGRPKGSGKKQFLTTDEPKVKRPVGRPRKDGLPAGSLGVIKRPATRRTSGEGSEPIATTSQGFTQWRSVNADTAEDPQPPPPPPKRPTTFAVDPSLEVNEWAELLRSNPNTFLLNLLSSLSAPNPVSTVGPSVEEAFKSNLVSLSSAQAKGSQSIPSLYSILKTFWLPSSPAYFSLTASASTARTPPEHRFLYWDPQPLVFNGISCPICSNPLTNKGRIRSGPIKVYDLDKPFFVIGCEYVCKSAPCVSSTSSEGRKFASTDLSILRSLPAKLKDEFPAHLLQGEHDSGSGASIWNWKAMGVSRALWNMVKGALKLGLSRDIIIRLIRSIQNGVPDETVQREEEEEDADADKAEEEITEPMDTIMTELSVAGVGNTDRSALNETFTNAWRANAATVAVSTPLNKPLPIPEPEQRATATPTPIPQPPPQSQPHPQPPLTVATPTSTTPAILTPPAQTPNPLAKSPAPPVPPPPITTPPNHMPPPTQIQAYGMIPNNGFSSFPVAYAQYGYLAAAAANGLLNHPPHSPASSVSQASRTPVDHSQSQHQQQQQQPQQQPPPPSQQVTTSTTNLATIGANPLKRPYSTFMSGHRHSHPDGANPPGPLSGGGGGGPSTTTSGPSLETVSKRAPRHCCKCGSQDCKGKGGRSFCMNACQDCGKLECKGRNSRRPDKTCAEAWN